MALILGIISTFVLGYSHYWALMATPADRMMGDVYRILFVHVPAAWVMMVLFLISFIGSVLYLIRKKQVWDSLAESAAEVGLVLNGLALALGSIWGRPTWGVWWTWDPRLTTTALLFLLYAGYLLVRQLLKNDPDRCAKISSAMGLLIFLNVPIVYMSVRWWRSLHQVQSSPTTMAPEMVFTLRLNAVAMLIMAVIFLLVRFRIAQKRKLEGL